MQSILNANGQAIAHLSFTVTNADGTTSTVTHFVVVNSIANGIVTYVDSDGKTKTMTQDQFMAAWTGNVLCKNLTDNQLNNNTISKLDMTGLMLVKGASNPIKAVVNAVNNVVNKVNNTIKKIGDDIGNTLRLAYRGLVTAWKGIEQLVVGIAQLVAAVVELVLAVEALIGTVLVGLTTGNWDWSGFKYIIGDCWKHFTKGLGNVIGGAWRM